jgi:murein DD-endopeptidase MepM/ murein hydrolase activator NlpD
MHQRRFKNKSSRRIFHYQGRFSLMHLGGGTFLYSFPGRNYPIVGKLELGRKKYRNRGLGAVAFSTFFFMMITLMSGSGTADPITQVNELKRLEAEGRFQELEMASDELKDRLVNTEEEETRKSGKVKFISYKVRSGDTLSAIALRYRVPASMIAVASDIKIQSTLSTGQELSIPDRPGLVYKFKKGDTLAAVAQHYSVKIEDVMIDNPEVADLDLVEPGQSLFLPNAKIPAPPIIWVRPVLGGRITSRFGYRRHPIRGYRHLHSGMDIGVAYKSVRAARDGQVMFAGYLGSYGKAVIIRHEGGFKTLYAHLSKTHVRPGQFVKAGGRIATSGNTGSSTGAHLHFEVIKNNRAVNPRRYVRF